MVNPRKSNLAPLAVSRTNSSQPLARASKKTHPTDPSSSSSARKPAAAPSVQQPATTSKSPEKTKKKTNKLKKASPKPYRLFDHFFTLLLFGFSLYIASACPSDEYLLNPACKGLALWKHHILEPFVVPPIRAALSHPVVEPYVSKANEITHRVEPYVLSAVARAKPVAQKTKSVVWDGVAVPTYQRHVVPRYRAHVSPQLNKIHARIEPYTSPVQRNFNLVRAHTTQIVHHIFVTTKPHVQRTYDALKPYAIRLYDALKPFALRAYDILAQYVQRAYDALLPHWRRIRRKLLWEIGKVKQKLYLLRREYVDKHISKIWDRVQELSRTESIIPGVTATSNVSISEADFDTKADAVEPTPSSIPSLSSVPASSTSNTPTSSSSAVPEESVVVPVTSSDLASEALPASIVEAAKLEETVSSAASIAAASLHITAEEVTPSPTESPRETPDTPARDRPASSAASVILASSASPSAPAAESIVPISSDDSALDELLSELELEESIPDVEEEFEEEPSSPPPQLSPEELKEQQRIATAAKRADIVGRHKDWQEKLDAKVVVGKQEVRDMLGRVRRAAARALVDQSVPPAHDPEDLLFEASDLQAMRFIDQERVSLLLDELSNEGSRLLKGLDGYLRKEEKSKSVTKAEADGRLQRWQKVIAKVQAKFQESVTSVRVRVRDWFIAVRDIEIRECLASGLEVKKVADSAQSNLGMDYAWLDDVTYHDWDNYHDLARTYERFDEEIRQMQNGTHAEPVEDPVMAGLNSLQAKLDEVVAGWSTSLRKLQLRADDVFKVPEPSAAPEPEVSILPIDTTPQDEADTFDSPQVVLGKSAEQVEEALKNVPIHEEL